MSSGSSWTSNDNVRSNAVCSCGAATCIRTSWTEANPGRRFLCCTDGCGLLRWIEPPVSCPRYLMRLKAKEAEARRLKFVLGVSWLLFIICVVMW
ncbi:hypothetical protein Hanom_Chr01g00075231 [Helianthus anomalus]